jgi:hypothetical protein
LRNGFETSCNRRAWSYNYMSGNNLSGVGSLEKVLLIRVRSTVRISLRPFIASPRRLSTSSLCLAIRNG